VYYFIHHNEWTEYQKFVVAMVFVCLSIMNTLLERISSRLIIGNTGANGKDCDCKDCKK
jgi:hypothetical protein